MSGSRTSIARVSRAHAGLSCRNGVPDRCCWIIEAFASRPTAVNVIHRLSPRNIAVSVVTLGEVFEGAFNSSNPRARLDRLRRFLAPYRVMPVTATTMEIFAEIRAYLRRRGQLISDFDMMLGATALQHSLTVLTFNVRHLSPIPDLVLYQPS